jgi:hypothetical protein
MITFFIAYWIFAALFLLGIVITEANKDGLSTHDKIIFITITIIMATIIFPLYLGKVIYEITSHIQNKEN